MIEDDEAVEATATATAAAREPGQRHHVRWTSAMAEGFLDHLAATCHVAAAAAHVGVSPSAVHALRRRNKRFAARWAAAVESGYQMLETQLIGHALSGGGPTLTNGAVDLTGPIDVTLAMSLLAIHRDRVSGKQGGGPALKRATAAETDAAILRKLAAMKRGDAGRRAAARKARER